MPIDISKFETIDNELRSLAPPPRTKDDLIVVKLLNDETLFIPEGSVSDIALNKYYEKARKLGHNFHKNKVIMKDRAGFILWFTKKEEVATNGE